MKEALSPTIMLEPLEQLGLQTVIQKLLLQLKWDDISESRIGAKAAQLITEIRAHSSTSNEIETFLKSYGLNSTEGRALMTLAEALLRIPDTSNQDALIDEKISASDWKNVGGENFFMKSAGMGLGVAKSILAMGGLTGGILGAIGRPVIRKAIKDSVRRMGGQFVIGETIDIALKSTVKNSPKDAKMLCSFDMLGEGARCKEDAEKYYESYKSALIKIGEDAQQNSAITQRHSISIKLSALHPKYDWSHKDICVEPMIERLLSLMSLAAERNIALTIDAEESERLELSLLIMAQALERFPNKDWTGFGLAVQAYDRRCMSVLETVVSLARRQGQKMQVRLVKGAYWDGEIKRAQIAGWPDYAVFQRKSQTDLSYLTAAQYLLNNCDVIYPMFATHNAYTAAAILDFAANNIADEASGENETNGYEFQRLFGMGGALGDILTSQEKIQMRVYAPVGAYEDLLPYLVRRMLENGANASFVAQLRDSSIPVESLTFSPIAMVRAETNPAPLPLPLELYDTTFNNGIIRRNSAGIDLSRAITRAEFFQSVEEAANNLDIPSEQNQSDSIKIVAQQAMEQAKAGFQRWNAQTIEKRAEILEIASDLLETHKSELMALLQQEGKKTYGDALSEIRESVDFLRYYSACGRRIFTDDNLRGPTGERNVLGWSGRGVFVCISPWNFPLAIFIGQISAALMAGNAVVAKPAEQTPKVAEFAVSLLHKAGVERDALILVQGDGEMGSALISTAGMYAPDGVAFTGSNEVAGSIAEKLYKKGGAIIPFIAETGGQNAMIVDSTALAEQVVDDVLLSAFGSAGQRCSALRVLYLQEEIADRVIKLLSGAMDSLCVGSAHKIDTDVAEVIDSDAQKKLLDHMLVMERTARRVAGGQAIGLAGCYIPPTAYEISSITLLPKEVFGPILHIIRFDIAQLDKVIREINGTGYGLTFGIHSRLQSRIDYIKNHIRAGNIYINKSMIGAVVGVQPFGGTGLSGTGPKAGGPYYLTRFAQEISISNNIVASGGNIDLVSVNYR